MKREAGPKRAVAMCAGERKISLEVMKESCPWVENEPRVKKKQNRGLRKEPRFGECSVSNSTE